MAAGGANTFKINVRYGSRESQEITVNKKWTAKDLKQHIVNELRIESGAVDLIFTGQDISDDAKVEDLLGEHTYVNAVKASGMRPNYPTLDVKSLVATENARLLSAREPKTKDSGQCYYVYCRRKCRKVQPAKLRVRCATCKLGTLIPHGDPGSWEDVMTPKRISGECRAPNCQGSVAEFFFKCAGHNAKEKESLPPLRNVVTNTRQTPCIVCFEDDRPQLYVFECPDRHVMCLECLKHHWSGKIQNRQFQETPQFGYTLPCPAPYDACQTAYITDPHNFKIVGEDLYQKYQNYATQEYVLQEGGVLCPAPNCAYGVIPPKGQRRVECRACKLVFCRKCSEKYHDGNCNLNKLRLAEQIANDPTVSPERAEQARLERETYRAIDELAKECPRCNAKIHKITGCNHMTCTCGFNFCWLCLVEWSGNCQDDHWFRAN